MGFRDVQSRPDVGDERDAGRSGVQRLLPRPAQRQLLWLHRLQWLQRGRSLQLHRLLRLFLVRDEQLLRGKLLWRLLRRQRTLLRGTPSQLIPTDQLLRGWMLRRRMLRGRIVCRHPELRRRLLVLRRADGDDSHGRVRSLPELPELPEPAGLQRAAAEHSLCSAGSGAERGARTDELRPAAGQLHRHGWEPR